MNDVTYQIHWLGLTVKAERQDAFDLYENLFADEFGPLQELGNGGRGFREIFSNTLQLKLYLTPASTQPFEYWHLEIPGKACESISPERFLALGQYMDANFGERMKLTRIDFAFDHVHFSPEDVEKAIRENAIRTLAKRETLKVTTSPFALRDDGEVGTYTVELGSNVSNRMITVYNRRGYTRLELQCKNDRADLVGKEILLSENEKEWFMLALSHLRDYIDFEPDWWSEFVYGSARAFKTISKPREISMGKLVNWLDKQISPALSVAVDVLPKGSMDSILNHGRRKRGGRWNLLLENANVAPSFPPEGSHGDDGIPAE